MDDRYQELVERVRRVRHDANNPLTAALGNVQLLIEDDACRDAESMELLRIVESELRRLASILRQLNDIRSDGPVGGS